MFEHVDADGRRSFDPPKSPMAGWTRSETACWIVNGGFMYLKPPRGAAVVAVANFNSCLIVSWSIEATTFQNNLMGLDVSV